MDEFFEKFGIGQWLTLVFAVLAISSFILNLRLVKRQEKRNDIFVEAYRIIDASGAGRGPDKTAVEALLLKQRRLFVAEVFKTIDPVRRGEIIKELAA